MSFISSALVYLVYSSYLVSGEDTTYRQVPACLLTADNVNSSMLTTTVRSQVECAAKCAVHPVCQAFRISRHTPYTCILHNRTLLSHTCRSYPNTDYRGFNVISNPCLNGGEYVDGVGCKCFHGYVGTYCENLVRDCDEIRQSGQYPDGKEVYIIYPNGAPEPFQVFCNLMEWGGRTYLTLRDPGVVDFNRSWADYKSGFGDFKTEFWLGLDKFYYVTNSHSQRLIAEITTRMPSDLYPYRQHFYNGFTIGNESTGYAFNFVGHWGKSGNQALGDCLTEMKGKKFTTVDVDNDDDPVNNCASIHEGAWWFTGCGECNPLGPIIKPTSGYLLNIPNEVFWKPGIPTYSVVEVDIFLTPWP